MARCAAVKLRGCYRGQSGFTALELICAVGMLGLLTAVLSASVIQVKSITPGISSRTTAAQDVISAGHFFYRDVMMAQTSDLPENGQTASSVRLTWMDTFEDAYVMHTAYYYLDGGELRRNYDGQVMVVSRHVTAIAFWSDGTTVYMTVTSRVDDRRPELAATRIYQARMRAVA